MLPYTGDDFMKYSFTIKKGDDEMIFSRGSVPVRIVAKVYGKNPDWVRRGIIEGYLPLGVATKSKRRTNFYISPKKLYDETGYIWKGEKR